jgi:hypothetical protein
MSAIYVRYSALSRQPQAEQRIAKFFVVLTHWLECQSQPMFQPTFEGSNWAVLGWSDSPTHRGRRVTIWKRSWVKVTVSDRLSRCVIVSKWGGGGDGLINHQGTQHLAKQLVNGLIAECFPSRLENWQKVAKVLWDIRRRVADTLRELPVPYGIENHWSCCQQIIKIACKKVTSIFFLCGDVYFHIRVPSFLSLVLCPR